MLLKPCPFLVKDKVVIINHMNQMIIDVREPDEFVVGHATGAINLPPDKLMAGAHELCDIAKDTKLIVYCRTGSRSNVAMHILRQQGFVNVINGINKEHVMARYSTK